MKSLSRLFLFFVILLLSVNLTKAQTHFREGYYVTTGGDTVRGFIVNRSAAANFRTTLFKSTPDAEYQVIYPGSVESFAIANSLVFEKHTFKEKSGADHTGFFRVEVRGKLTLLTDGKRYFALKNTGELLEVSSRKEVSGTTINNRLGYGTVKVLMGDCPKTNEDYLLKEYSNKNLKKIFITYNECVGSTPIVSKVVKEKPIYNFGVQVLPSIGTMNAGFPMNAADMSSVKLLAGGVFVSAFLPQSFQKVRLLIEGNYYEYTGYGYYKYRNPLDQYTGQHNDANNDIYVKYQALQVPLVFRMGNKFFWEVGLMNNLMLHSNITLRVEQVKPTEVTTSFSDAKEAPKGFSTGLLIGGGAKFEVATFPVRVFVRYSRGGSSMFSSKPGSQMASIGLSFQFTKN